jgi:magnesium transporter
VSQRQSTVLVLILKPRAVSRTPRVLNEKDTGSMVMLSELRRFHLVDGQHRRVQLLDMAIESLEVDYPPITRLFFQQDMQHMSLPWEAVQSVDWQARHLHVTDLAAGQAISPASRPEDILLARDILDALVLDLQNRRVTRANDLGLEEKDQRWWLTTVDTSLRALVRRLSRGLYGPVQHSMLIDWQYIEFLRGAPQAAQSGAGSQRRIARLPAGEIARLTDPLPYLHAAELLILLPDPLAAETLEGMMPERQLQVFEELKEEQALRLLVLMAPDIAADLVGHLDTAMAQRYLNRLPRPYSERIVDLLRYPEDTVGGIMTNDIVTAPATLTVREARRELPRWLQEPDFVYFVYIVEDDTTQRLCGVVTLRHLCTADAECLLGDIMQRYLVTSTPLESARTAAYRLIDSGLMALPVVGDEGQILGAVTVDAAVAQVAPARWRAQAPRVFT